MTIKLLLCVDGTHENLLQDMSPAQYAHIFDGSHVRSVGLHGRGQFGKSHVKYRRGPAGVGTFIDERFVDILNFVIEHAKSNPREPFEFFLSGYSRGGAMALDLANGLCQEEDGLLDQTFRKLVRIDTRGVVDAFKEARRLLAGRSKVKALMLFDAVDMSKDIDGNPVSAEIERLAHVVRSLRWGSRKGWGNVGTDWQPTTQVRRLVPIDGTHAALGGLPATGDLPKPLAALLLADPRVDWADAERRFRKRPAAGAAISEAAPGGGTHVVSNSGGAAGFLSDAEAGFDKRLAEAKSLGLNVITAPKRMYEEMTSLKSTLQRYVNDPGTARGGIHCLYDKWLGGFQEVASYFKGRKDGGPNEAAATLIATYMALDRSASELAMKEMRRMTGRVFFA
ncbi:MAG TPA: hypothetical protein VD970_01495 [Acetobacteraceae bacterium]|nr:hypothetical protein [Acetobacteraceae bacterium]